MHAELAQRRVYLPARWTSLGLSLIEAMQLGMPGAGPGHDRGRPGRAPRGRGIATNPARLASAFAELLADRARARRVGRPPAGTHWPTSGCPASSSGGTRCWPRQHRTRWNGGATATQKPLDSGMTRCPPPLPLPSPPLAAPPPPPPEEMMAMRIDMVSEHASPLAVPGGVDAGGQNVHVRELARRWPGGPRDHGLDPPGRARLPERIRLGRGVQVRHLAAGPARPLPRKARVAHVPAMADALGAAWGRRRPDLVGAPRDVRLRPCSPPPKRQTDRLTFNALGSVKRRHQGRQDTSPSGLVSRRPWCRRLTLPSAWKVCTTGTQIAGRRSARPARTSSSARARRRAGDGPGAASPSAMAGTCSINSSLGRDGRAGVEVAQPHPGPSGTTPGGPARPAGSTR